MNNLGAPPLGVNSPLSTFRDLALIFREEQRQLCSVLLVEARQHARDTIAHRLEAQEYGLGNLHHGDSAHLFARPSETTAMNDQSSRPHSHELRQCGVQSMNPSVIEQIQPFWCECPRSACSTTRCVRQQLHPIRQHLLHVSRCNHSVDRKPTQVHQYRYLRTEDFFAYQLPHHESNEHLFERKYLLDLLTVTFVLFLAREIWVQDRVQEQNESDQSEWCKVFCTLCKHWIQNKSG